MATDVSNADSDAPARSNGPVIRIVYRSGAGAIHHDWAFERIREALDDEGGSTWVDINDARGHASKDVEGLLRDVFQFHPLAIEDALQDSNVPKVDDWERYLYLVFHSINFDPETDDLRLHELDIFLGNNYLVTYHYEPVRIIDQLRESLRRDNGHRLRRGADHVLYQLLDLGVAEYLPAVEHLDDAIDEIQDEVFRNATPNTLRSIFRIKRSALRLHRIIIPQREVLNRLARDNYAQIDDQDRIYFRDVYDHAVVLQDISETLRDLIAGALDTYLSAVSNRSNEIMKVLTVATVMFLPLNFVVGFFGMNFFGDTLAFQGEHWASTALFWTTCAGMLLTPLILWYWVYRRGWFLPNVVAPDDPEPDPGDDRGALPIRRKKPRSR